MRKKIIIGSDVENLRIVEKLLDEVSAGLKVDKTNYGKIMVTTMEAVNNAIVHGNKMERDKRVNVTIYHKQDKLKISVEDEGPGFVFDQIPDPTAPENIEKPAGRGVFLMRKLADEVKFNKSGNKVTLIFNSV